MHSPAYIHGIALFNEGQYFEAHEALEDVWREARDQDRKFLQGLIQVAVALHHHSTGNRIGATSLLARAAANLSAYPESFGGIHLDRLLREVQAWRETLADGGPTPPPPKLDYDPRLSA
jgi:predicted metal-dependent hydrolase